MDDTSEIPSMVNETLSKFRLELNEMFSQFQAKHDANMARLNSSLESKFMELLKAINGNQATKEILDPSTDSSLVMVAANPIDGEILEVNKPLGSEEIKGNDYVSKHTIVEDDSEFNEVSPLLLVEKIDGDDRNAGNNNNGGGVLPFTNLESIFGSEGEGTVNRSVIGSLKPWIEEVTSGLKAVLSKNAIDQVARKVFDEMSLSSRAVLMDELVNDPYIKGFCFNNLTPFDPGGGRKSAMSFSRGIIHPLISTAWEVFVEGLKGVVSSLKHALSIVAAKEKHCFIVSNPSHIFSSGNHAILSLIVHSIVHGDDFTEMGLKALFEKINSELWVKILSFDLGGSSLYCVSGDSIDSNGVKQSERVTDVVIILFDPSGRFLPQMCCNLFELNCEQMDDCFGTIISDADTLLEIAIGRMGYFVEEFLVDYSFSNKAFKENTLCLEEFEVDFFIVVVKNVPGEKRILEVSESSSTHQNYLEIIREFEQGRFSLNAVDVRLKFRELTVNCIMMVMAATSPGGRSGSLRVWSWWYLYSFKMGGQFELKAITSFEGHKVCVIHWKTAKVHVDGVEQGFFQQCSRFHSFSGFDDGKSSCRKYIAGYNEQRRKNHMSLISRRRLIPQLSGTNFLESYFTAASHFVGITTSCLIILVNSATEFLERIVNWCQYVNVLDSLGIDCRPGHVVIKLQYFTVFVFISTAVTEVAQLFKEFNGGKMIDPHIQLLQQLACSGGLMVQPFSSMENVIQLELILIKCAEGILQEGEAVAMVSVLEMHQLSGDAMRISKHFGKYKHGWYSIWRKLGWGQFFTVWLAWYTQIVEYIALHHTMATIDEGFLLKQLVNGEQDWIYVVKLLDHLKHKDILLIFKTDPSTISMKSGVLMLLLYLTSLNGEQHSLLFCGRSYISEDVILVILALYNQKYLKLLDVYQREDVHGLELQMHNLMQVEMSMGATVVSILIQRVWKCDENGEITWVLQDGITFQNFVWHPGLYMLGFSILEDKDVLKGKDLS